MGMFNLIKYDWLRRWKFFLAGIVTFLAVNFDLTIRIPRQQSPSKFSAILCSLLFALVLLLLLDHIGRIYRPLFTDEAFWELTLPLNGYQFLGAKLLAVSIELAAAMLLVALVAYFDVMYISKTLAVWQFIPITGELVLELLQVMGLGLGGYLMFLLMVYLSVALAKSLFAPFKHGKLISFGCFLVIAKIIDIIMDWWNVSRGWGIHQPGLIIATEEWLFLMVIIGILFAGTGYLLDKKINL
jgi:hypothetical protein